VDLYQKVIARKIHHINKIKGQKIEMAIHHTAKVSSSNAK
jgi:hypothetical protein